jgi:hypothetical protein
MLAERHAHKGSGTITPVTVCVHTTTYQTYTTLRDKGGTGSKMQVGSRIEVGIVEGVRRHCRDSGKSGGQCVADRNCIPSTSFNSHTSSRFLLAFTVHK